jgi:hypothetical protein
MWVLTNRPTGEAFRRNGSSSTSVTVDTSDGAITRVRSDRENLYYGANAEKLAAIGTGIPEPVVKLLNMDADLNLQRQLDAPFLLSCSAGEAAQRLNAVVGLDDIDIGLASAQRRVRQHQSIFQQTEKQCDSLSMQVESFAYLTAMEGEIDLLERQFGDLLLIQSQMDSLSGVLVSVHECQSVLCALPDVDMLFSKVFDAEQQLQNYNRVYGEVQELVSVVGSVAQINGQLEGIPDVSDLLGVVGQVDQLLQQLKDVAESMRCGEDLLHICGSVYREISALDSQMATSEERLRKEFPVVCPLCGRKGKK